MMQQQEHREWSAPSASDKDESTLHTAAQYERAAKHTAGAQVTTLLVTECSTYITNKDIQNKPMQYREGMASQPSPVQGGISNDIATQGTHAPNSMMQVADVGELTDTKEVEEQDRGLMLRRLFGDDMDHLAAEHWQDLSQTVVSGRWQYEIVTAAVALLTGGCDFGGDAECRPTAT